MKNKKNNNPKLALSCLDSAACFLFGWIGVVMDHLRVVPPCSSPLLHPPPLCCSAASPKHDAKRGHFAAQLPGTPPEKWGAAHHLPGLTDVAHGLKFLGKFSYQFLTWKAVLGHIPYFLLPCEGFPNRENGILVAMNFVASAPAWSSRSVSQCRGDVPFCDTAAKALLTT